ncbi:hypothetical protein GCM10011415_07930 [Salipiger pallidus]|uniref:Uncharacterized protein n=1 Tax=Salipiger pallidus TaxID=1775170 RepID=A0A8J3EFG0_9RHOB|nr:hypothetical protein [Salipiger pallidus]GGG63875.1 hypothetical protein GCM10011415_07930 [Salipiger pallidus]
MEGIRTTELPDLAAADTLLVIRDGSTGVVRVLDLATQIAGTGVISEILSGAGRAEDVELIAERLDEVREVADQAFDRHDVAIEDATGTVAELIARVQSTFGAFGDFGGLPLAEAIERSIGPLTAPVPLSTRIEAEEQRLTDTLPRIRSVEQTGRDLMQRMMALADLQWSIDQRLTGAGIYVDPEDGTVKIEAFEYLQDQVSDVRVTLDAATAKLELSATQAYVDQEVFRAITDPSQLHYLDDLIADVRKVEITLDGVNGTLEQHASALTVDGGLVTMTSVTSTLDSLQGQIADRVTNTDFNDATARLAAAEQVIEALPDAATITQSVEASRIIARDVDQLTARSIADMWGRYEAEEAIRVSEAQARSEQHAYIDEQDRAIASDVTELRAAVDTSNAQIRDERRVRAAEDEALGESITQVSTGLASVSGQAEGTADAVNELTGRVARNEEGLTAEAASRTLIVSSVRELRGEQRADTARSIVDMWNAFTAEENARDAVAVSLEEVRTWVEEGLLAEAIAREVLGAALGQAQASIVSERTARTTADEALAQQADQLTADLGDAQAAINAEQIARASADEALAQQASQLSAGLGDAQAAINAEQTVRAAADEALSQQASQLSAGLGDAQAAINAEQSARAAADEALSQQITQAEAALGQTVATATEELSGQITQNETGLTSVAHRTTALETGYTDAQAGIATNVEAISGLSAQQTQTEEGLALVAQDVSDLEVRTENIEGETEAQGEAIGGLTTRMTQTEDGLEVVSADLSQVGARLSDAETGVSANGTAITQTNTRVSNVEGAVSSQGQSIVALQNGVEAAQDAANANASAIDGLETQAEAQGNNLVVLAQRTTELETDIIEANGEIAGNAQVTSTLGTQVERIDGEVHALSTQYDIVSAAVADNNAWISNVAATRVTAAGAVAAVNQQISASYGNLTAMAAATAFAQAGVNGISAGYVFRLNGQNVFEMVSVTDGVSGPVTTARLAPDYVQITGIAQINTAVVDQLFAEEIITDRLFVGGRQIIPGAVSSLSHEFAQPYVSTNDADFVLVTSTDYTTIVTLDPLDVEAGSRVRLEASCNIDAPLSEAWGLVAFEMQYRANEQASWSAWEGIRFSATGIIPGKAADGQMSPFTHATADTRSATEQRRYRLRARLQPGSPRMRICRVDFFAQQIKR